MQISAANTCVHPIANIMDPTSTESDSKPRDTLPAGIVLPPGESLVSSVDESTFTNGEDGNLCVSDRNGQQLWESGTSGKGPGNLMLLTDGNLVLFDTKGNPIWASMSQGLATAAGPCQLIMGDEHLEIFDSEASTWGSWSDSSSQGLFTSVAGTAEIPSSVTWLRTFETLVSRNGLYTFVNQGDGNLVIYNRNGTAMWASGTSKKGAGNLYMQRDGNLVLYNSSGAGRSGKPIWSSGTAGRGTGPYKLILQDDANLVIYDLSYYSEPIWTTNVAFRSARLINGDTLLSGDVLPISESLLSKNRYYKLLNSAGILDILHSTNYQTRYRTVTSFGGAGNLYLQTDGNLVLYNMGGGLATRGTRSWSSDTPGRGIAPYKLIMQDDSRLVLYDANSDITWANTEAIARPVTRSELYVGSTLLPGESLVSKTGKYTFVNQGDGCLHILDKDKKSIWYWGPGKLTRGELKFLTDGNLVLFDAGGTGRPVWASMTQGLSRAKGPHKLIIDDEGQLMIIGHNNVPSWNARRHHVDSGGFTFVAGKDEMPSSVTWLRPFDTLVSKNGMYTFVNQGDGNLVVYDRDGKVTWASGTCDKGAAGNLYMQRDGNLVLYSTSGPIASSGTPMWSSGETPRKGHGLYRLVLQNDGNLVILDNSRKRIWPTNPPRAKVAT